MPSRRSCAAGILLLTLLLAGGWAWWRGRPAARPTAPPDARSAEERRLVAAVEREPESATVRRELGRHYLRARQPFEALWELDQVRKLAPGDRDASLDAATAL